MTRDDWCERNPDLAATAIQQWTAEEGNPNLHKQLNEGHG
jgi:hypothetical protein